MLGGLASNYYYKVPLNNEIYVLKDWVSFYESIKSYINSQKFKYNSFSLLSDYLVTQWKLKQNSLETQ